MKESTVTIGGKTYKLTLSTEATQNIGKRYGGIAKFGEELFKSKSFEDTLDEIIWLVAELINAQLKVDSFLHNTKFTPIETEMIAILTTPADLPEIKDSIINCINTGMKREIKSEETISKNEMTE